MNKKALVTGAAGFIGSHLCDFLVHQGIEVVAVDSLKYGMWENIQEIDNALFKKHTLDFSDLSLEELKSLLKGCNYVFHLAAEKHNNSIDLPDLVSKVNVLGTSRLFDAAGESGAESVVFTSSLYAIGRTTLPSISEDDLPVPNTTYGVSKLAGEGLLRRSAQQYGFNASNLRLFFNYGPKQYPGLGYPSVIVRNFMRLIDNQAPIIKNDGKQILDYIFVGDTINALWKAANINKPFTTLNIGSGQSTDILSLTEIMQKVAGTNYTVEFGEPDWTANTQRVCTSFKAQHELNWKPKVSLEKGLGEVWQWLKRTQN